MVSERSPGRGRAGTRTLRTKLRRDLRRQWPQTAALVITVLLGVALFAASYDAYRNLRDSYAHVFAVQRFADLWIDTSSAARAQQLSDRLTSSPDLSPDIAAVAVRSQADLSLQIGPDKLPGRVVGVAAGGQPDVDRLTILSGSYPAGTDQVAVEQHLADHFELRPGDGLQIRGTGGWRSVTVAGVASSAEYLWPARSRQEPMTTAEDFGVVFAPQPLLDGLEPGAPGQVQLLLSPAARAAGTSAVMADRARTLGATSVTTRADQASNSLLQEDIDGFKELSSLFPLLFLGAAGMASYVLLTRRVDAEREVIGMLLASGLSRHAIAGHYVGYGLLLGTMGGVLGVAAGEAAARVMSRAYLNAINLPSVLSVLTVARPTTIATGLAFGILAGTVSALAPALAAARMAPAEAMRGVVAPRPAGPSTLERLVPPLRHSPTVVRLVLRGVGRNRRRTAFTALGVVLSLLVILTSWTMLDTMAGALAVQFDQVTRHDAQVSLLRPADRVTLDELRAVPGVAEVEPMAQVPITVQADGRSYTTAVMGLPASTTMHGFRLAGGGSTDLHRLSGNRLLVGQGIRDRLPVSSGSVVNVVGPDGNRRQATIAGLLDEPLGTYLYAPLSGLDTVTGPVAATSALIRFDPGADRDAIRRTVTDLPDVAAYQDSQALKRSFDDLTGLFVGIIGAMFVLGTLMAFAIIFTTMSVNIIERTREIATLRTAGVRRRAIAGLVAGENLLTTLLGVIPGLALGVLGGKAFLASFSNDQFRLDLVVRPLTLAASALAILAVAALSQWPGLRAVARQDLAQTVRERSG